MGTMKGGDTNVSHRRFTNHKAVEDAFDALLLLAYLTNEEEHYTDVIDALRQLVREQRNMIVLLSSEKEILASGNLYKNLDPLQVQAEV